MDVKMDSAKIYPQVKSSLVMYLGPFSFGIALAWSSNITNKLMQGDLNGLIFREEDIMMNVSIFLTGAVFSPLIFGFLADSKGRRTASICTVIPFAIGWLVILSSANRYMLYVGRFITGLSNGCFVILAPIYITEISQKHVRGILNAAVQIFITLGYLYSFVLGWILPLTAFNIFCMMPSLVFGFFLTYQPESPCYYAMKGRYEDAAESYRRLRGNDYDYGIELKYVIIEIQQLRPDSFCKVLMTSSQIKAAIICLFLIMFQHFSGLVPVIYHAKLIFVNFPARIRTEYGFILIYLVCLVGTLITTLYIDHVGRKMLLCTSASLCAVSSFLLGLYFTIKTKLDEEDECKVAFFLPTLALLLFIVSYHMGLATIPWLSCAELLTAAVRAKVGAAVCAASWALALLFVEFYFQLTDMHGKDNSFYLFMGSSATCVLFVTLFLPEMKKKMYLEVLPHLGQMSKIPFQRINFES